MSPTLKHNIVYYKILTRFGFDLSKNWYNYPQEELNIVDELAEAMHIKGTQGRCPGRTLWDRAKAGRPF